MKEVTTMLVHLLRNKHDKVTHGILVFDGIIVDTLELPWLDNQLSISCIPDGEYKYKRDFSNNKKRNVIELLNCDTYPRSQIQIHVATKLSHLKGCIGVPTIEEERLVFDALGTHGTIKISTIK